MKTSRLVVVLVVAGLLGLAWYGLWMNGTRDSGERTASTTMAGADGLPEDVYPDSRNRLPLVKREDLTEERQKIYDEAAAATDPLHGLQGEVGIRLHSVTDDVRFESPLGRALTELAIITAAREAEQNFEWTLHAEEALRQGLDRSIVDIVRFKQPVTGLGDKETAIITIGREMAQNHSVSSETFAFALEALGASNLVDMAATMARRANETPLIWVDQHLPLDWEEIVPMPIEIIQSPPDIHPDSRSRLPQKEGQRPPTPGRTLAPYGTGPGQIRLHSGGGEFLEENLGRRLLELAALATARELDQQVVSTLHELRALEQGLEPEIIDVVRHRRPLTDLGEREAAVIQIAREMIGLHRVSPETYANGVRLFGERDALDLAFLMEEVAITCGILTIFDQQLPVGQEPLLPIS